MTKKSMIRGWWAIVCLMGLPTAVQATGGPVYVQEHYRWRNDNGNATSATWKANMDLAVTNVPHNQNIRLRFSIANVDEYGNFWHNFEYATATNGPWASVAPQGYGACPFEFSDSAWFVNETPAGNLLPGTGVFSNGPMVECDGGNIDVHVAFAGGTYINTELCFQPTAKAKGGTTFYFRLPVSQYAQYAALTMEAYDPPEAPKIVSPLSGVTVMVEKVGYGMSDSPDAPYRILASGSEPIIYEATGIPAGYALFGDTIADDGTPSTPGNHTVTLTVHNAYGSDTQTLALAVASNQFPAYRTLLSGEVGKPFSYTAQAAGTAPIAMSLEVTGGDGLPAGLTFDGARTISGTPQAAGMTRLLLTATNAANGTADGPATRMILTITGESVPDADGDGMDDTWEILHFGSTNDPTGAAGYDADEDGMTNLAEFKAGTLPKDTGSALTINGAGTTAGSDGFVVSWDSVLGKSYGVQKSTNLVGGGWQPLVEGIQGDPPVNSYTDTVGSTRSGYYRVKVQ